MKESCELKAIFNTSPKALYEAWLIGEEHAEMTGGDATGSAKEGTEFTAWDGYIWGTNKTLTPHSKIIQAWRTAEFAENDDDSIVEISLTEVDGGTELTITHTNIPEGQTQYEQGWVDHYIDPMTAFFND